MNPPDVLLPRLPNFKRTNGGNFSCAQCRDYAPAAPTPEDLKGPEQGVCTRFPPTPGLAGMQQTPQGPVPIVVPMWPPVLAGNYCGEFTRGSNADN